MANRIQSEDYIEFLVPNSLLEPYEIVENVIPINYEYSIVTGESKDLDKCSIGKYYYSSFPTCYTLSSTVSIEETGVSKVQNHPNLELYGSGTLIGFIDTGIQYTHKAFKNPDGTSRIISLWDQTLESEEPSADFPYGIIYSQEELNEALKQENPLREVPSTDEDGHGTTIAGIAAGSIDRQENFIGVAPLSELIVVKLKPAKNIIKDIFSIPKEKICYQESDIMMGVKYILSVASRLKRPLVICIALGSNQTGHDGLGALNSFLSYVARNPRYAVVVAAGNEGHTQRHFSSNIETTDDFKDFELKVGEKDKMFSMEIWQHALQRLSIEITAPTGEKILTTLPGIKECKKQTFVLEPSVVWLNNIVTETDSGDQLILIRFENLKSGVWKFRLNNIDHTFSQFNAWLPNGDLISEATYFLGSNPNITITTPGDTPSAITICAYDTSHGGETNFSSRGYTRSDIVKPDLAAPGTKIMGPSNIGNNYASATGTGVAAAFTTGIVSMIFEWAIVKGNYTDITGGEIKSLLIRGAKRESELQYPNNVWGYGKVDVYGVFEKLSS